MVLQLSAILVPPASYNVNAFEKFLSETALPVTERAVLTRITVSVQQSILKGEDQAGGRTYYLWRAELNLMNVGGSVAPTLIPEMFSVMREQLSTQNATITELLTLALPAKQV
jgi:hypothetical protein